MAVFVGWYDGHDPKELIQQELVAAVRPEAEGETFVELQSTFRPMADSLEIGQTNFGLLAVRVAKHLSAHFGGGQITSSEGAEGEPAIFGKPARWMDYSGPAQAGGVEGITYFDHPANPSYPTAWHVREDGWMSAAVCLNGALTLRRAEPLVLRYLLHAHRGPLEAARAEQLAKEFASRPAYEVVKATVKHEQFVLRQRSK